MSSNREVLPPEFTEAARDVAQRDPAEYAVDGLTPRVALAPASVDEVSTCLAAADAAGLTVVPWGGGTQMGLGNLPASVDVALDLRQLNAIVHHEPDDLTIALEAGVTLGDLNRKLAGDGQMLPVDAAQPDEATIGGLVAAGLSGPRRFGYGPLRDLIIGITVVLPDGRVSKGGGMVVKNVTGFDMMRLYHASLGSLAVITQVNFKLIPLIQAERTVVASFPSLSAAAEAAETVRLSQLGPTAIVALNAAATAQADVVGGPWTLLLRCEAPPVAVVRQAERIGEVVAPGATGVEVIDHEMTAPIWRRVSGALSAAPVSDQIGVRLGVMPSQAAAVTTEASESLTALDVEPAITIDFGSGLVYLRVPGDGALLQRSWSALSTLGQHATLLTAPAGVKQDIDVFGREPAGFSTMQALKAQFDPNGTLNRGRFIGHL